MTATQHKQTTDRRQIWTFVALAACTAAFFGYTILPYMDPARSPLVGQPAPDFTLPIIVGGEPGSRFALSDQHGKTTVLDFWASWCAPCRAQAPVIQRIAERFDPEKVTVVGVNTADQMDAAVRFAHDAELRYASVFDKSGAVAGAFGANQLPTLVIVDSNGIVRAVEHRVMDETEIAQRIQQAAP